MRKYSIESQKYMKTRNNSVILYSVDQWEGELLKDVNEQLVAWTNYIRTIFYNDDLELSFQFVEITGQKISEEEVILASKRAKTTKYRQKLNNW